MDLLLMLLLTLAAGGAGGFIFVLLKIPNGLRFGALLGAALLQVFFGTAWVPSQTKYMVQVIAGALIGCSMEKSDLRRLPWLIKPTAILIGTYLILTLSMGALVHAISPLDWVTSLMSVVPGGITDIPIIAADMGADTPKVALVQLSRYILGVTLFPPMIQAFDNVMAKKAKDSGDVSPAGAGEMMREKSRVNSFAALACTLAVGSAAGFAGYLTRIPAGTFLFSSIGVLVLKLKFDFAHISPGVKKIAILMSGCYIGSLITMEDVRGFGLMALPVLIVLCGYTINCFVSGRIISKTCGFNRKDSMLATTPAGASDIALNSADLGVINTDIIAMHVFRALFSVAVFPQIINALLLVLP